MGSACDGDAGGGGHPGDFRGRRAGSLFCRALFGRELEELRRLMYLMKGEILFAGASLDEGFERAGERLGGAAGAFALRLAGKIRERRGEEFREIWEEEARAFASRYLNGEDLEQMLAFGRQLGYLDRQMQERTILLYLEQLEMSIGALQNRKGETCRLCAGLSLAGGLFLVIIMC